jgi:LysR family hydrogen peroxide-inducible transcriptional activator
MDLTQIHYFLALARTLNFTRAAEACHVTQPALTKSIQRLEQELGGPLLLRERSLTHLTPLGQAMLPLLEQIHDAAERAKEHAAGMKRQTASPLRLGFGPDVPAAPFMPLFKELAARLPGFELSLADAGCAELCDAMLHGGLDAAVVTGGVALPERLHRWTLFTDQAALLIPPGHALAAASAVPLAALDGGAVVCRGADCRMAGLVAQAAREHEAFPAQRHWADTAGRAADMVRAGLGIAFSTEWAILPDGLDRRPVAGQAMHDVVLVAVAGRPTVRAADAFIKLARAREWSRTPQLSPCMNKRPTGTPPVRNFI